jgi:hypothetical protein
MMCWAELLLLFFFFFPANFNNWSLPISGGDDGTVIVKPIFQIVGQTKDENISNFMFHSFYANDGPATAVVRGPATLP